MRAIEPRDREHALEGSVNFRDLGGLETRDGHAVRRGTFFRSDALARLTEADLEQLRELGIATMVDLRTDDELRRYGVSPLREHGVRHVHLPLLEQTNEPEEFEPDLSLGDLYIRMLERASARVRMLFEAFADAGNLPAVVHCTAGKDRTGLTVALVLQLLGVDESSIVADYAMTDRNMARLIESRREEGQPISQVQVPEHYMRAVPETMEYFLATLDERWGSVHGYLDEIGVDVTTRDAVRANLLERSSVGQQ